MLGAVTPPLAAYAVVTVQWLVRARQPDLDFAFHAMWLMSFVPFVGCLLTGMLLAAAPRPRGLVARYALGFAAPALLLLLLAWSF